MVNVKLNNETVAVPVVKTYEKPLSVTVELTLEEFLLLQTILSKGVSNGCNMLHHLFQGFNAVRKFSPKLYSELLNYGPELNPGSDALIQKVANGWRDESAAK